MTRPLVFLDTETTSLGPDRRPWEIAAILREPDGTDTEYCWFVDPRDLDLGNADPASLQFGRYYDRHSAYTPYDPNRHATRVRRETDVLHLLEGLTRGATLLGSNPAFDADMLATRMRANGICPSWHYRLEDVPTMAKGWLYGTGRPLPEPAKSDQISLACGVDPQRYDRHTALGDCRWIRDLYDTITRKDRPTA
ncbi:hypothetical protein [Actinoplanes sp. NBRC 101535]|uniref:3'-5' exonuclease n=1 Tax=Actinoplanes sp. NBRC 101535 TaxID=3032196 RepID=UPI0024A2C532|nr:hypothetical protein [Actinoplanes sp. NBRC 101535]GLY08287.1 hypothetical protein Acsp01_86660 [Actinoplanes sp. NBRC 101535]